MRERDEAEGRQLLDKINSIALQVERLTQASGALTEVQDVAQTARARKPIAAVGPAAEARFDRAVVAIEQVHAKVRLRWTCVA